LRLKNPKIKETEKWKIEFLKNGIIPDDLAPLGLDCLDFFYPRDDDDGQQVAWQEHKTAIMRTWIAKSPGSRCWAWWKFEAPEIRRRIGGTGTCAHDTLSYKPEFEFGMPTHWTDKFDEKFCRKMKTKKKIIAIDADDRPTYESEATYLRRLDLLSEAEMKKLKRSDFSRGEEI